MTTLNQLINSRWFPTLGKPILAGAIAAGITFALHAFGVTSPLLSGQVNGIAMSIAGLLVAAIVAKPSSPLAPAPAPQPSQPSPLADALVESLKDSLVAAVDANPELVQQFGLKILELAANPRQEVQAPPKTVYGSEGQSFQPAGPSPSAPLSQAQEAQDEGVIK